jgi:nucleotide-binding universal stress UspA family protein
MAWYLAYARTRAVKPSLVGEAIAAKERPAPPSGRFRVVIPVANPNTERFLLRLGAAIASGHADANGREAELIAVSVIEVPQQTSLQQGIQYEEERVERQQELLKNARDMAEDLGIGIRTRAIVGRSVGDVVLDVIEETDPDHVGTIVELSLKHADALQFKLAQVAATFGALKGWKQGSANRFGRDRLLDALEDTPMYDEALRAVRHEDLAVVPARDVLAAIQSGDLDLATVGERTPVGLGGRSGGQELLAPENADAGVIETVRERIQNDQVILFCLHCQDWETRRKVRRVSDQPECPACGSTRIAALNPWADEVVSAVKADDKDDEQETQTERAYRAASLVQSHGKQAVVALAARGVGPHNAARIISKLRENEDDFYRDILAQEREYARTQSFWD